MLVWYAQLNSNGDEKTNNLPRQSGKKWINNSKISYCLPCTNMLIYEKRETEYFVSI